MAPVPPVARHGVAGEKPSHEKRQAGPAASKQDMGMVDHQCPDINGGLRRLIKTAHAGQEILAIVVDVGDIAALGCPVPSHGAVPGASSRAPLGFDLLARLEMQAVIFIFNHYHHKFILSTTSLCLAATRPRGLSRCGFCDRLE
jgi:hypothetical protein